MKDFQTPHRQAWLQTLQPKFSIWDLIAVVLGAATFLLALFL